MVTLLMKLRHILGRRLTLLGLACLAGKWQASFGHAKTAGHP